MKPKPKPDPHVVRFAFGFALLTCFVGCLTLAILRWQGLLDSIPHFWPVLIVWSILLVGVFPGSLWLLQQPWIEPWLERMGALLLFGLIPATIIWSVFVWWIHGP